MPSCCVVGMLGARLRARAAPRRATLAGARTNPPTLMRSPRAQALVRSIHPNPAGEAYTTGDDYDVLDALQNLLYTPARLVLPNGVAWRAPLDGRQPPWWPLRGDPCVVRL